MPDIDPEDEKKLIITTQSTHVDEPHTNEPPAEPGQHHHHRG